MAARRQKRKLVWAPGQSPSARGNGIKPSKKFPTIHSSRPLTAVPQMSRITGPRKGEEDLTQSFLPGTAFVLKKNVTVERLERKEQGLRHLIMHWSGDVPTYRDDGTVEPWAHEVVARANDTVVYLSAFRSEEWNHRLKQEISVLRHVFMVPGAGPYVIDPWPLLKRLEA